MKRLQLYLIPALVLALCLIGAFWFAPYLAGRRVLVALAALGCTLVVFVTLALLLRGERWTASLARTPARRRA